MAEGERWRARAFGLDVRGDFSVPGLSFARPHEREADAPPPVCSLHLVSEAQLSECWPGGNVARVAEETFPGEGEPARTIDFHPDAGYRLYARHFGLATVSTDGRTVLCAPPGESQWRWQRFLVGRILPLAAVAGGIECFHASAVVVEERAVAIVGASGAGKSSLAMAMVLAGAGFLTDDVLALEPREDSLVAHPGSAIASLRLTEEALLSGEDGARLGDVVGRDDKTYVAVDSARAACALGAVYFLARREEEGIAQLNPPDPRLLLASTFIFTIRTPARLANQLDVCAQLAAAVPMYTAAIGADSDPRRTAQAITAHARQLLA